METLESLAIRVEQQNGELRMIRKMLTDFIAQTGNNNSGELILGRFRPGELIRTKDERLWIGSGAPFTSYQQVLHAKRRGCPFTRPDDVRIWSIKAEDLEEWLTASKHQALINLS